LVYAGKSQISGRGLFTRVPVKKGTVLAFYNGVRQNGVRFSKKKKGEDNYYRYSLVSFRDLDKLNLLKVVKFICVYQRFEHVV